MGCDEGTLSIEMNSQLPDWSRWLRVCSPLHTFSTASYCPSALSMDIRQSTAGPRDNKMTWTSVKTLIDIDGHQ